MCVFTGLAIKGYEPLYHNLYIVTLCSFSKNKSGRIYLYLRCLANETVIPPTLVGYEIITDCTALTASLAIFDLISNKREWDNCLL